MSHVKVDTVRTSSFTMDYCRFGHGREAFVILPGVSLQRVMGLAEAVANAYMPLTDAFTVYLFERRNDMPPAYSIAEMARDTAQAIQALGLTDVCLFGASQGGMIALEITIMYPQLIRRLMVGSSSAHVASFQWFERCIQLAKAGKAAELSLTFGEALYPKDVFESAKDLFLDVAKAVTEEDLNRFATMTEALNGFDVRNDLDKITCPVLVIGSRTDRVLGGDASVQIAERFNNRPDCELFMYDGYGHAAYDLAPDYKERLLRFCTKPAH